MLKYAGIYVATFLVMFLVDMLWLRVIAASWYQAGMGHLMAESPNLVAAALFYLLFPVALMVFAILPGGDATGIVKVAGMGALFGLCAYATYDLTNLAVLKNWPVGLSVLDMAWGALVSGLASSAGKLTLDWLK